MGHKTRMATVIGKMATLQVNLATVLAQMATHAQILAVILIKAMRKCIGRDENNESSFIRDENVVEIVQIWYKNCQSLSKTSDV